MYQKILKEYTKYLNIHYSADIENITKNLTNFIQKNEKIFESVENKGKRNPLFPKKATNGYQIFAQEIRDLLSKKGVPGKDYFKIIGEKWNSLSEDEKKGYDCLAVEDKERYIQEKNEKGLDKKVRKNKISGYNLFCKENNCIVKKDNPSWNSKQVLSETSRRWKILDEKKKEVYLNRAQEMNTIN